MSNENAATPGAESTAGSAEPTAAVAVTLRGGTARAKLKGEAARIFRTFALAGALFVLPVGVATYNYVHSALKDVAFAKLERVGVDYLRPAQDMLVLLQRHAMLSKVPRNGDVQTAGRLKESTVAISKAVDALDHMSQKQGDPLELAESWKKIKRSWSELAARGGAMSEADNIASHDRLVEDLTRFIQDVGDRSNLILDPDLDTYYLMDITILRLPHLAGSMGRAASVGAGAAITKLLTFDQRLGLAVFAEPDEHDAIVDSLARSSKATASVHDKVGPSADKALRAVEAMQNAVRKQFLEPAAVNADLDGWLKTADPVVTALLPFAGAAATELDDLLAARIYKLGNTLYINLILIAIATTLALALLSMLARRSAAQVQRVVDENDRNQAAVMRFMDELAEVANGNLKAKISVTQDITGTIADMVNQTIEQLSGLVVGINRAAGQVASDTAQARNDAEGNLSVAEKQAHEVRSSAETVSVMARSILDVSSSAMRSVDVARRSMATAGQGTTAVKHTIEGMTNLREQIQETAKRIKRLGESSQEIGEIVNLLSDLTEQTNVLALNAAIQAAAAGEAGKGFSVVAEEVQRLAERSAGATRQIGAIINTIQTDTKDTIAAMERSTQGVVDGARLSDDAGRALGEIERVTSELAELIQSIAVTSQRQSEVAGEVAGNMHRVLELTDQASQGTKRTTASVGHLSELAEQLKVSVAGFKV